MRAQSPASQPEEPLPRARRAPARTHSSQWLKGCRRGMDHRRVWRQCALQLSHHIGGSGRACLARTICARHGQRAGEAHERASQIQIGDAHCHGHVRADNLGQVKTFGKTSVRPPGQKCVISLCAVSGTPVVMRGKSAMSAMRTGMAFSGGRCWQHRSRQRKLR